MKAKKALPKSSPLLSLNPFMDDTGLIRLGGRQEHSRLSYDSKHPTILHGNHPVTKLIIHTEHLRPPIQNCPALLPTQQVPPLLPSRVFPSLSS